MTKLLMHIIFVVIFLLTLIDAVSRSQCKLCPISNYPICATNGSNCFLFKNECRLIVENMKLARRLMPILQKTEIADCFKNCDQVCTNENAPICATTMCDSQRTFVNRCQLDLENCKTGNNWMVLYQGECIVCPTSCTWEYSPICATLGDFDQTFPNICQLNVDICESGRKWQIKNDGECVEPEPTCNENCPKIYSPICATFNGENRTFTNECLLDCVTGNQWDILYRGECTNPPKTCQTMCPEMFEPICACNNGQLRTFTNQCFLDVEVYKTGVEWIVESSGECKHPSPECPQVCPFNYYQPVCACSNGMTRTFSNMCLLNVEACNTGVSWEFINDGECAESTTTAITVSPQTEPTPLPVREPCENAPDIANAEPEVGICICPSNYDPICAMINGATRTFSNKCQLDAEISRTKEAWEIVGAGECECDSLTTPTLPTGPCPKCFDVYQPVCGFSDGEQKTFTNECQLIGENCYSNRKWVLVYEGECKISDQQRNCPNICPLKYDPVCGTFNGVKRTFPNECELNYESYKTNTQWVFVNGGECDCCPICSDESDPVCAENNGQTQTFDNSCKMEYENCKTGSDWLYVHPGPCYTQRYQKTFNDDGADGAILS